MFWLTELLFAGLAEVEMSLFMNNELEREELIAWATRHRLFLRNKTADEVAYFARMNEFSLSTICEVLSHWSPTTGLDMKTREAFAIGSELHYLENLNCLRRRWQELGEYLTTGKEWQ